MADTQKTPNIALTMPTFGKHNMEKCQSKFKTHFLDKMQNPFQLKQNIVSLAINCHLHEELIRPHSWKIFLNTLSFNDNISLRYWMEETYKKRELFKKKLKEAKEKYNLEQQKFDQNQSDKFSNFEENSSIKHLLEIDVERTYGDTKLFKDEYIRRMEEDILYVFSQENNPTSYKQGMNEILAIFIHSFYPFYKASPVNNYTSQQFDLWCGNPGKYLSEIYSFFHDEKELQSDLYYIMYNIMHMGLNKFYEDSIDPECKKDDQKTYLLLRCDYILDKLRKHNLRLYQHFMEIGLSAEVILQRWLKCIFSREFTPEDCIYIWDNIIANEFNIPSKNLEYIDYFCVAMFDYVSENLLTHDQNECFICLFKYPPFQTIDILVNLAERVKENVLKSDKAGGSLFSNFRNKIAGIKLNDITGFFNKNNDNNDEEPKKVDVLAELKAITDNKTRIIQLRNILSKYRSKFYADDRMKIDLLLTSLEKNA